MYWFSFFFSDEYLILTATEDLKNSILGGFFWEMGDISKMQFCCALIQVSNFNFIFLPSTYVAISGDWGELSKNYFIAFCPHIDWVSMQNLKSVASMMSEKRCLDMTDRRTDMAKSIFLVALIKIYIIGSHMSPSTCYMHSA